MWLRRQDCERLNAPFGARRFLTEVYEYYASIRGKKS